MMQELVDPVVAHCDYVCSKYWLFERMWLRVDKLESELRTLRHIREGEHYLDAVFQEAVTPLELATSNSSQDRRVGLCVRQRNLVRERKDPIVVVHVGINIQ
eukprot:g38913.t1